jgi:hypothetical protein
MLPQVLKTLRTFVRLKIFLRIRNSLKKAKIPVEIAQAAYGIADIIPFFIFNNLYLYSIIIIEDIRIFYYRFYIKFEHIFHEAW